MHAAEHATVSIRAHCEHLHCHAQGNTPVSSRAPDAAGLAPRNKRAKRGPLRHDFAAAADDESMLPQATDAAAEEVSRELLEAQEAWHASAEAQAMLQFRQKLPSAAARQQLLDAVAANQVVIVSGAQLSTRSNTEVAL